MDQEDESTPPPQETPARRALRMETRGLIALALMIFVVYLVRYFYILYRSAPQ